MKLAALAPQISQCLPVPRYGIDRATRATATKALRMIVTDIHPNVEHSLAKISQEGTHFDLSQVTIVEDCENLEKNCAAASGSLARAVLEARTYKGYVDERSIDGVGERRGSATMWPMQQQHLDQLVTDDHLMPS